MLPSSRAPFYRTPANFHSQDYIGSTTALPFTTQSGLLTTLRKKPYENIVGKGENAGYQYSQKRVKW